MDTDSISEYLKLIDSYQNFSFEKYLWVIPVIVVLLIILLIINYRVKVRIAKKGAYQALQAWEEDKKKKIEDQEKTNIN